MLVLFACITGFDQHQAPNTLDAAAAHRAWHLQEQQASTDVGETPAILNLTVLNATKHPDARCADGSPGAYYHTKSTRQGRYKWVFELSGGATCGDGKSCSEDVENIFSTKHQNLPPLMKPQAYSIMYDAPMRDWNRVMPMYCSMDFWTGGRTEATSETFGLYFSGRKVLEGILGDLDAFHGLEEANEILFTGVSGGSVGVAHYLDRMAARYPNARVTGVMSSGFYFHSTHYTGPSSTFVASHGDLSEKALPALHHLWNASVDESCAAAMGANEHWRCLLVNNSYPYIDTPKFIAQAQTDSGELFTHEWLPALPDGAKTADALSPELRGYLSEYSHNMSIALAAPMASTSPDGVWSPACYAHRKFEECLVGGKTFNDAFASWYVGGQQVKLADTCGILCNPTCPDSPLLYEES